MREHKVWWKSWIFLLVDKWIVIEFIGSIKRINERMFIKYIKNI